MDQREALSSGSELLLQDKCYIIDKELGRGSNAIVYQGRYRDRLNTREWHTVLIKELFPCHHGGAIYRGENGSIICKEEAADFWQEHFCSFENGNRVHIRMVNNFPADVGSNIDTCAQNNTYYSLLGFTGGRSLLADQLYGEAPLRQTAVRMGHLLEALGCFHQMGYLHLDIAPDNIVLIGSGSRERVMLIDFNSVHPFPISEKDYRTISMKSVYAAPELRNGNYPAISQASDLYAAAAVFFQCLTGKAMTLYQMSRPSPPDVSEAGPLRGMPDTVLSMVREILHRGLASLPRRRYQTVEEMQRDFSELIDRIDGIGITHCALWEAGRASVMRTVRNNPALSFLKDKDEVFPVHVQLESGEIQPIEACFASLKAPDGEHLMLTGEGGAGKTSSLLRFVISSQQSYSPFEPAVFYLSLFSRRNQHVSLMDMLLETLHFSEKTGSFEEARHALRHLLDTPLRTARGDLPTLILLVDGLNEYNGPREVLVDDLRKLMELRGLRLLAADRGGTPGLSMRTATVMGLRQEDVKKLLLKKGLLLPESPELQELLQNSLMLSIFLRSADASDSQLLISSKEELLETYFSSLLSKELSILPEDTDERYMTEASIRFVLPAIAHELHHRGRPLSDAELLPMMKKLYALTKTKAFFRLFPSWVGHSAEIRGHTESAEDWYGLIVHRLLWRRLALLIRLEEGMYRLPHDVINEYLCSVYEQQAKNLRQRRLFKSGCIALLAAAMIAGSFRYWGPLLLPGPDTYEAETVKNLLSLTNAAYRYSLERSGNLQALAEASASRDAFDKQFSVYIRNMDSISERANYFFRSKRADTENGSAGLALRELLESGEIFAENGASLREQYYWDLINRELKLSQAYMPLADALESLVKSEIAQADFGEQYRSLLKELTETDRQITTLLYQLTGIPRETPADSSAPAPGSAVQPYQAADSLEPDALVRDLEALQNVRSETMQEIDRLIDAIRSVASIERN